MSCSSYLTMFPNEVVTIRYLGEEELLIITFGAEDGMGFQLHS